MEGIDRLSLLYFLTIIFCFLTFISQTSFFQRKMNRLRVTSYDPPEIDTSQLCPNIVPRVCEKTIAPQCFTLLLGSLFFILVSVYDFVCFK